MITKKSKDIKEGDLFKESDKKFLLKSSNWIIWKVIKVNVEEDWYAIKQAFNSKASVGTCKLPKKLEVLETKDLLKEANRYIPRTPTNEEMQQIYIKGFLKKQ